MVQASSNGLVVKLLRWIIIVVIPISYGHQNSIYPIILPKIIMPVN